MGVVWSDQNRASSGGTEAMMRRLEGSLPPDLLDEFQVFPSRVTQPLDETKIRVLWCHDLAGDPMYDHLKNGGWSRFHKIVFVSHHQQAEFQAAYEIPPSKCAVVPNAIEPLPWREKPAEGVKLIYTSTPHRGLNVLLAAFIELAKRHEDVTLDVYSGFSLYGWEERDKNFESLFKAVEDHPKARYHGVVPNEKVREALLESHVFAYPSTWRETSCLCLLEAMSADLVCVHSNLGALYETSANWTVMYPFNEHLETHAGLFLNALEYGVQAARTRRTEQSSQKNYVDLFYDWKVRAKQWEALLRSLLHFPREIEEKSASFIYNT